MRQPGGSRCNTSTEAVEQQLEGRFQKSNTTLSAWSLTAWMPAKQAAKRPCMADVECNTPNWLRDSNASRAWPATTLTFVWLRTSSNSGCREDSRRTDSLQTGRLMHSATAAAQVLLLVLSSAAISGFCSSAPSSKPTQSSANVSGLFGRKPPLDLRGQQQHHSFG